MARKRRNKRGFVAIPFASALALTTLADDTVLEAEPMSTFTKDFYAISVDCNWTIRNATPGQGPIEVGWAHGDYDVTELGEALDAQSYLSPSAKIEQEQARRLVRRSGVFPIIAADEVLNDGKPIRTKLKFGVDEGYQLAFWVANRSGAALTTGAIVEVQGTIYGRWR